MSDEDAYEPRVPWALRELIEQGAAPLDPRPQRGSDLDIVIVLEPGCESVGDVGLPDELESSLGTDPKVVDSDADVATGHLTAVTVPAGTENLT